MAVQSEGTARHSLPTRAEWEAEAARLGLKRLGGELVGPCPQCGGEDRFYVRADGGAYCRKCCPDGRDSEAVAALFRAAGFTPTGALKPRASPPPARTYEHQKFDGPQYARLVKRKVPKEAGWKTKPLSLDAALAHLDGGEDHRIGVVPASVGCFVIDIDVSKEVTNGSKAPNPEARQREANRRRREYVKIFGKPIVALDSLTTKGAHLWYQIPKDADISHLPTKAKIMPPPRLPERFAKDEDEFLFSGQQVAQQDFAAWREALDNAKDDPVDMGALLDLLVPFEWPGRAVRREWGDLNPPPVEWLVEGWIPANRVTLVVGVGGGGKSRLALQLATALASGSTDWLPGGPPLVLPGRTAAPAVFATWENDLEDFMRLLAHSPTLPDVGGRFVGLDLAGSGSLWGPQGGSGHIATTAGWTATAERLKEGVERVGARLLIVDPLAAAYGSDENARALVRGFMGAFDGWARDKGVTVVLIAHPPKGTGAAYAGSTDWHAAPRGLLSLQLVDTKKRDSDGPGGDPAFRLSAEKQSYAAPGEALWLAEYPRWKAVKKEAAVRWRKGGRKSSSPPDSKNPGLHY